MRSDILCGDKYPHTICPYPCRAQPLIFEFYDVQRKKVTIGYLNIKMYRNYFAVVFIALSIFFILLIFITLLTYFIKEM